MKTITVSSATLSFVVEELIFRRDIIEDNLLDCEDEEQRADWNAELVIIEAAMNELTKGY